MAVATTDIKLFKAFLDIVGPSNGGRKGNVEVLPGVRLSLLPRITENDRVNGVSRLTYPKKLFHCNFNEADDVAFNTNFYGLHPTNGGDHIYYAAGTFSDTQADLSLNAQTWMGVGALGADISAGATSLTMDMESDDFQFPSGGKLHIADCYSNGQTIDSGVNPGDTVYFDGSKWTKIAYTPGYTYPNGIYLGGNSVLTEQPACNSELLVLKDNLYTDEVIGTGDGIDLSPTLSSLTYGTNGIVVQAGKLPVLTATIGAATKTATVNPDGTLSGDVTAGLLNLTDGTWTTQPIWTGAPDDITDITITYRENNYSYTGNTVTVQIDASGTPVNAYTAVNTFCGGVVEAGDIEPELYDPTNNSAAGTFTGSSVILTNKGTEEDTVTLTFTSPTAFTAVSTNFGSFGAGSVSSAFAPLNPATSIKYFEIPTAAWGGAFIAGDVVTFKTHPAAFALWLDTAVPADTAAVAYNAIVSGWENE